MHITKEGTRRTIRSVLQFIAAVAVAWPIVAAAFAGSPLQAPLQGVLSILGAVFAVIVKLQNGLEEAGKIPAILRPDVVVGEVLARSDEIVPSGDGPGGD